jgi:hypothetical protein
VIQDLRLSVHHDLQGFLAPFEVGDQHFDGAAGLKLADTPNDHRKDRRAAILALVAVDGCDDHVLEFHGPHRLGNAIRLVPVHHCGAACLNVTKAAGAGADIAQHQEGGSTFPPAFAEVGAHGLFAHRVEFLAAHQLADVFVGLAAGCAYPNPVRAAARLFRLIAGCLYVVQVDNCHPYTPV